jgi:hypothetical protein
VIDWELRVELQDPPSGTRPSLTVSVTVAAPAVVQLKFALEAFGVSNVPLVAVQEKVIAPPSAPGPDAVALRAAEAPTLTSVGLAAIELIEAQLYAAALI